MAKLVWTDIICLWFCTVPYLWCTCWYFTDAMIVMVMMTAFHNLSPITWQHELLRTAKLMSMDVICWCFGDVIISLSALGCHLMSLIHTFQSTSYSEHVSRVLPGHMDWGRRAIKVQCRHDVSSLWSLPSIWGFPQWHEVADRWEPKESPADKKPESDPQKSAVSAEILRVQQFKQ